MAQLLAGFAPVEVDVDGIRITGRTAGTGPPVLLLHGYPQTHVMWHQVAPILAERHTVVLADLRGYGGSTKPAAGTDHAEYSKRTMAADQVAVMASLGFDRFAAVGHDRGARVVHRMCLDHPDRVSRAAVLDIVPTRHVFATADTALAMAYEHWFFLAQPPGFPEHLIAGDPEFYLRAKLAAWSAGGHPFDETAVEQYVTHFRDPAAIAASCEDYRAAATIDLEHDDAGYTRGDRITCPLLVTWGTAGFVGRHYDVAAVWQSYATDVSTTAIASAGHFLAEEAPAATAAALSQFLR
ncbi:alpha/beta hydrolase [Actinoplanes subtropicus]|uniref:alpha/beta hydrolase n=1 Tax=Actinoplanes subtropicus TaxID=543632 RepID=UPI00068D66A0|nr:alpha/beta hydrolase [Actinoplanes subtropicus]